MSGNIDNWEKDAATDAQRKKLFAVLNEQGIDKELFEMTAQVDISTMLKGEMSKAIGLVEGSSKDSTGDVIADLGKWAATREDSPPASKPPGEKKAPDDKKTHEQKPNTDKSASAPKQQMQVGKAEQLAEFYGIPKELANMFFMTIEGALYVKSPGLLYMAGKKGYARILTTSRYDEQANEWEAETKIYPNVPKEVMVSMATMDKDIAQKILDTYYGPTVGQGRASKGNVKMSTIHAFLKEMAETRSVNRALRLYTGYGGTSYEEMPQGTIEIEAK